MELEVKFIKDHAYVANLIFKFFSDRGYQVVSFDLYGVSNAGRAGIECQCRVKLITPQGDPSESLLSHLEIRALIIEELKSKGYNRFELNLTAVADGNGAHRQTVCHVTVPIETRPLK